MKNMKRNVQQGFTLIELMIIIAIVAILVALAVPAYQDYTIRAKVAECINSAAPAKLAVAEFFMQDGVDWPTQDQSGLEDGESGLSQYCEAFVYGGGTTIDAATITVSALDAVGASGVSAMLTPSVAVGGNINWACTNASGDTALAKYLPSSCRGT